MLRRLLLLAALLPLSCLPLAAQRDLTVHPEESAIHFTLNTVLHTVHGTFHFTSGTLRLDPATGNASGLLVVDATSGSSGNAARDRRMSESELKSSEFHSVSFAPKHFTGALQSAGASSIVVTGTLTLLGAPHEITVPVTVEAAGKSWTAKGSFSVPFVAWGLKDPSTLMLRVSKDVQIDVVLHATSKE